MPLSKEQMREYMIEYRRKHPEYEQKRNQMNIERAKYRYENDAEFREKAINNAIKNYQKKKNIVNIPDPISC